MIIVLLWRVLFVRKKEREGGVMVQGLQLVLLKRHIMNVIFKLYALVDIVVEMILVNIMICVLIVC